MKIANWQIDPNEVVAFSESSGFGSARIVLKSGLDITISSEHIPSNPDKREIFFAELRGLAKKWA